MVGESLKQSELKESILSLIFFIRIKTFVTTSILAEQIKSQGIALCEWEFRHYQLSSSGNN